MLLSPEVQKALRAKVAADSPQWRAFRAGLNKQLPEIDRGCYQGSELAAISDYALGYQLLKDDDPRAASAYADKAIALMQSALHDYQKGDWHTRRYLARGDGSRVTFPLPHRDVIPSSLRAYLAPVAHVPLVRGAGTSADEAGYYRLFLKVSDTPDGPPDYQEGKDWRRSGDLANNLLDWSPHGKKPAPGARYFLTCTAGFGATNVAGTVRGGALVLARPPAADQALLVEYVYGTHRDDGSSLAYQQTSAGDGGFNSILIDTTYPSRYLGKHVAMGLDWLDGYPAFPAPVKEEALDLLVRWSDYVRDHGYYRGGPSSNYEAGAYVSRVLTALALARRHPAGPRLLREVLEYRERVLLPMLEGEPPSLRGGFWPEGWNYGALAAQNLLLAGLALESQGVIPRAAAERRWAAEVIRHLVSAQPAPGLVYDGGDWFAYPAPFPGKGLLDVLSAAADDAAARSHANYILQNYPPAVGNDYTDLLYRDPAAPAAYWSELPLQHFARGTGLLTARSDWGRAPVWVAFQMGNLLPADHQSYTPGQLQIRQGADDLLINGNAPGKNQPGCRKSSYGNTVILDDHGAGTQVYRESMGVWYGEPGVVVTAYEAADDHVYVAGDCRAAYSLNTAPGGGGPARELTRQLVYVRPGYVVVHDRVTTATDTCAKQQRWHFLAPPRVDGTAFEATAGASKLFGQTFSSEPLTAAVSAVEVGSATVQQLRIENRRPAKSVRFVTAFQVAPATTRAPDATRWVSSTDALVEGVQVGNEVVLFGRDGAVGRTGPITYQVVGKASVNHLLTDLMAGRQYQVKVAGGQLAARASVQGTLRFSTSGEGKYTVEVRRDE
jgi:hypothetical protein